MAYLRKNLYTKEYRQFDEKLKFFAKKLKKFKKIFSQAYWLTIIQTDKAYMTDEEFFEKLKEIFGTKKYTGETISTSDWLKLKKECQNLFNTFK